MEFIEEISGLTEKGKIQETAHCQTDSITQSIAMDQTFSRSRFKVDSNRGRGQAREEGWTNFCKNKPVRTIHTICLLPLFSSTRTKCYR